MGCAESSAKQNGSHGKTDESKPQKGTTNEAAGGAKPAPDPMSPAAQIANAIPPKSAMKKRTLVAEPVAWTPLGGQRHEGRMSSVPTRESMDGDDVDETGLMDRSFVKEDLAGSFRNLSFVSEKGDCRIEKGVMAPSVSKIPASSSDKGSSRSPSDCTALSPHNSDDDLVLVCMDCGREISEEESGMLCPVTAKLHG